MDFHEILEDIENGLGIAYNPYAQLVEGNYVKGGMSIDWLNTHFGEFDNVADMITKAESLNLESTVLYFEYLLSEDLLT